MDDGVRRVLERAERAALRRRARGILLQVTVIALAAVVLTVALRAVVDRTG